MNLDAPCSKSSSRDANSPVSIAENPDDPNNPITFKPVEFIFPKGESFKHYNMKWVEYEKMSVAPVEDARIEKILRDRPHGCSKPWMAMATPAVITAWPRMERSTCSRSTRTAASSIPRRNPVRQTSR